MSSDVLLPPVIKIMCTRNCPQYTKASLVCFALCKAGKLNSVLEINLGGISVQKFSKTSDEGNRGFGKSVLTAPVAALV